MSINPDISNFCAPHSGRGICKAPFSFGGHTVATNGKVIVFSDDANYPAITLVDYEKSLLHNYLEIVRQEHGFQSAAIELPDKVECPECDGSGIVTTKTCPECEGFGTVDISNDYSTYSGLDCNSCDGSGYIKTKDPNDADTCVVCDGEKVLYPKNSTVNVQGVNIHPQTAELINYKGLQACKYSDEFGYVVYLVFRLGNITGLIQSMVTSEPSKEAA